MTDGENNDYYENSFGRSQKIHPDTIPETTYNTLEDASAELNKAMRPYSAGTYVRVKEFTAKITLWDVSQSDIDKLSNKKMLQNAKDKLTGPEYDAIMSTVLAENVRRMLSDKEYSLLRQSIEK